MEQILKKLDPNKKKLVTATELADKRHGKKLNVSDKHMKKVKKSVKLFKRYW